MQNIVSFFYIDKFMYLSLNIIICSREDNTEKLYCFNIYLETLLMSEVIDLLWLNYSCYKVNSEEEPILKIILTTSEIFYLPFFIEQKYVTKDAIARFDLVSLLTVYQPSWVIKCQSHTCWRTVVQPLLLKRWPYTFRAAMVTIQLLWPIYDSTLMLCP